MKAPNVFSRDDVLRANEAMRRHSHGGISTSTGSGARSGTSAGSAKLSSKEINHAYAQVRKARIAA